MIYRKSGIKAAIVLALVMFLSLTPVHGEEILELDGEIVGGRFLVPMRSIFEGLGATVQWEGETRTVTGKKGDTTVTLIIDRKFADVNGSIIRLDVPAQIVNDRTYVPARFVGESLGAEVSWSESTRAAAIVLDDTIIRVYQDRSDTEEAD